MIKSWNTLKSLIIVRSHDMTWAEKRGLGRLRTDQQQIFPTWLNLLHFPFQPPNPISRPRLIDIWTGPDRAIVIGSLAALWRHDPYILYR